MKNKELKEIVSRLETELLRLKVWMAHNYITEAHKPADTKTDAMSKMPRAPDLFDKQLAEADTKIHLRFDDGKHL